MEASSATATTAPSTSNEEARAAAPAAQTAPAPAASAAAEAGQEGEGAPGPATDAAGVPASDSDADGTAKSSTEGEKQGDEAKTSKPVGTTSALNLPPPMPRSPIWRLQENEDVCKPEKRVKFKTGEKVNCSWDADSSKVCEILDIRKCNASDAQPGEQEYYVHFIEFDRRLGTPSLLHSPSSGRVLNVFDVR
eukprot:COSAG05_NODE_244_length_12990_cov_6.892018_4_plen_193_part_00